MAEKPDSVASLHSFIIHMDLNRQLPPAIQAFHTKTSIHSIPGEILSQILKGCGPEPSADASLNDYHSNKSEIEQPGLDWRLTCRAFRDYGWDAYAERISTTVFDLRSREHIQTLAAVANGGIVAQHVKALRFTCCNGSLDLIDLPKNAEVRKEFVRVYEDDFAFYQICSSYMSTHEPPISFRHGMLTQKRKKDSADMLQLLIDCLTKFPRLDDITFCEVIGHIPRRWRRLHDMIQAITQSDSVKTQFGYPGVFGPGLHALLMAMNLGGVTPTRMSMVVDQKTDQGESLFEFHSPMQVEDLKRMFAKTRVLDLQIECRSFGRRRSLDSIHPYPVLITPEVFPELHHLSLKRNRSWPLDPLRIPKSVLSMLSKLESLSIIRSTENDASDLLPRVYALLSNGSAPETLQLVESMEALWALPPIILRIIAPDLASLKSDSNDCSWQESVRNWVNDHRRQDLVQGGSGSFSALSIHQPSD